METTTTTIAPTVEVGDVFSSSWGWEQTNVDFYEVVALTPSGKSVRLRKIGKSSVPGSGGFMSRNVIARPGEFISNVVTTKRLRYHGDTYAAKNGGRSPWYVVFDFDLGEHIKRADVANHPEYESWYA